MMKVDETVNRLVPVHSECSDLYSEVVFVWKFYRVIVCEDRLQWILQKFAGQTVHAQDFWVPLGYFTSRRALERVWKQETGNSFPASVLMPIKFNIPGRSG
ncbi:hypothetical protein [Sulfitobacter sp. D7]|uniref:hypothetical protein n=1 Tax=Sulfitobacter sp. D7 TaxID=1968541 RepID=UPI0013C50E8B|nr:hypothetical protein [Sulfitobacter sp. D7]